ncbi:MAG: 50S ribosomal protein L32 [Deltaproteobacteria bacterium]|nr:50S ribosomal protein L32 [Deltaproteobacteria bacterium]
MTVPKRRQSKMKGRKRRTHYFDKPPVVTTCPNCNEPVQPHMVCPSCHIYKRRQVLPPTENKAES